MILARFVLEKGYPTVILFKAGGNESKAYDGSLDDGADFVSMMQFVNLNTGRGPPKVKVYNTVFIDNKMIVK